MLQNNTSLKPFLVHETDIGLTLQELLLMDLGFHHEKSSGSSHDFHAFPAKFPPQLPQLFIDHLTIAGDKVLDPMMGSGTCMVEALACGREAIGFDIDPLAVLMSRVKTNGIDKELAMHTGLEVVNRAEYALTHQESLLLEALHKRFEPKTRIFVDYWFSARVQLELMALLREIEATESLCIKQFLLLVFSAIIITKSGGVSLAWDLAHTRPHKLKQGKPKDYRPTIKEFKRRLTKNANSLSSMPNAFPPPLLRTLMGMHEGEFKEACTMFGNAEALPLKDNSIDLMFTSPPYASNAIDYMRAHKFSLTWMGQPVDDLSNLRSSYIGGEKVTDYPFMEMPPETRQIINRLLDMEKKKGLVLLRYYSEMRKVLAEVFRVLKPGKAAIFVVGTSNMRGIDIQTQNCLGELGIMQGFKLIGIGVRKIDRDRRMLPARHKKQDSQIEERMHEEYVVGFVKPKKGG